MSNLKYDGSGPDRSGRRNVFRLIHAPTDTCCAHLERASNLFTQGIGLIGRRELPAGAGLWLPGVSDVHTLFMRFPIDILFLDGDLRAVRVERSVTPGRLFLHAAGARHTIELGIGSLQRPTAIGDLWEIRPC